MSERARWEDAVDVLIHLHDQIRSRRLPVRWHQESDATRLADLEREIAREEPDDIMEALRQVGAAALLSALDDIRTVDPVYVTDDIVDAWEEVAPEFEPEAIEPAEPFPARALLVFPRSVRFGGIPVQALLWGGLYELAAWPAVGDFELPGFFVVAFVQAGALAQWAEAPPGHVAWSHEREWLITTEWQIPVNVTPAEFEREQVKIARDAKANGHDLGPPHQAPVGAWRDLQSLWRLAAAFAPTREHPTRATRRAAKRAHLDVHGVTVIRIRRLEHAPAAEPGSVDWTCRWIVRGHWRRLADGRQTYVKPYVKGPEGLPLRVTDRVWEFVR